SLAEAVGGARVRAGDDECRPPRGGGGAHLLEHRLQRRDPPGAGRGRARGGGPTCALRRAAASARTFSSIGSSAETRLLSRWPQRLGSSWSSICTAPAPAPSRSPVLRLPSARPPKP